MAKLTPETWKLAKADYEVAGLSIREIAKKYDVNASTVSRQAKKEDWQQGKTQHLVEKRVNVFKELHETQQQMQHFDAPTQQAINYEVSARLAKENFFDDSIIRNQKLANLFLERLEDNEELLDLDDLNKHSQITARNRDAALGKQPETAIQINNQVDTGIQPLTPELARVINQRLEDEY